METVVSSSKALNGIVAARYGATLINNAVAANGSANVIVATGASQFEMLDELRKCSVPWGKVTFFHLDEYIGVSSSHNASFQKFLKERFMDKLPTPPKAFNFVQGDGDAEQERMRLNEMLKDIIVDVSFVGIGENGHLAFNDPPCDMTTSDPFIIVTLDEACRKQQLGEGWFPTLDDVPKTALSMSMNYILTAKQIVCTVPDERKATAVKNSLEGPKSADCPASFMQGHNGVVLFVDKNAASLLKK